MKILIITGGSITLPFAKEFLKNKTFSVKIAADSGLAACHDLGICPTDILGDFDSLKNLELREMYRSKGVPVREFPTRKDYTDTHLAIKYAIDLWQKQSEEEKLEPEGGIWILGATGTRLDHTLSNLGMMMLLADLSIPCYIVDAHNEMEILKGPVEKRYPRREGKTFFSLLPFSSKISGLDLIGFSYPLENADLYAYESMGISNEITEEFGIVRFKEGYTLVVQSVD